MLEYMYNNVVYPCDSLYRMFLRKGCAQTFLHFSTPLSLRLRITHFKKDKYKNLYKMQSNLEYKAVAVDNHALEGSIK